MAGTFTPKVLAEGQLASSKGTIYTVPSSTSAYIKQITFYNTNASTQTIALYLKPGSTSRQIARYVLAQNEFVIFDFSTLLEAADLIEASSTNATAVDYIITGLEET
jgi:hypothetical protein